jgi:hypothetical protein
MTKAEVERLLVAISMYDNRQIDTAADPLAWGKSAELANWTLEEAMEAVHEHFAFDPNYLTQALLTSRIRDNRRDRRMRENAAQLTAMPRGEDPDWGRSNSPELEELHRMACEAMPTCSSCKSAERCMTRAGVPTKIPCLPRITAARHAGW